MLLFICVPTLSRLCLPLTFNIAARVLFERIRTAVLLAPNMSFLYPSKSSYLTCTCQQLVNPSKANVQFSSGFAVNNTFEIEVEYVRELSQISVLIRICV